MHLLFASFKDYYCIYFLLLWLQLLFTSFTICSFYFIYFISPFTRPLVIYMKDATCVPVQPAPKSVSMLKDGVPFSSLLAFLFASFLTIASFVFINTSQSFLLLEHLGLEPSQLAAVQGNLSAADEVVAVVMGVLWGVLSDRIGRRVVFVAGFLLMGAAFLLYPQSTSVYSG